MSSAALPAQIGKYWVKKLLGTGGMGRVFLAVDPDIGREVAIKLVTLGSDPQANERFLREAQTMGRMNHPNIVTLLEFGVDQQSPFLVLEFLSGEDLSQWMLRPHTLREQVQVMLDVAQAIAAAHKAGVLHRDLKPENVRVLDDGRCKLLDFGIAQSGAAQLTASGYFVGTPEFVAPEVMTGSAHTAAADIYALGLLFYTMLCGSNPFRGDTVQVTVARVVQHEPTPLAKRLTGVPVELAALIHQCLAKEPELRPVSADSLVHALTRELARIKPDERLGELPPPSNTAVLPTTPPSRTQTTASVTSATVAQPATRAWWVAAALLLVSGASAWWLLQAPPAVAPGVQMPSASDEPAVELRPPASAAASQPVALTPAEPEPKSAQAPQAADSANADRSESAGVHTDLTPPPAVVEPEASEPAPDIARPPVSAVLPPVAPPTITPPEPSASPAPAD
ncbi:MAG TPA: protein kinase, partial [Xanthomonadales bacterium]|nr:protein kinase [Xanthomonadales bacterium]